MSADFNPQFSKLGEILVHNGKATEGGINEALVQQKTTNDKIFSVAGGGETVAAIYNFKEFNSFTFVSTAGGAFLEYLEGKTLPGIKALNQNV